MENHVILPQTLRLAGLDSHWFESTQLSMDMIDAQRGTPLFSAGDPCSAFLILTSGSVRVELTRRTGRNIFLYRVKPSQTCVLTTSAILNNKKYYATGFAETDIEALAIPTPFFAKALSASQDFSRFVMKDYATRMSSLIHLMENQ